jgi:hypothetical protein
MTTKQPNYYLAWHEGCGDPQCNNETIVPADIVLAYRDKFDDWNVDEATGVITSSGDDYWKSQGKIFKAAPVLESDGALTFDQRVNFSYKTLHDGAYKVEVFSNEKTNPEILLLHEMKIPTITVLEFIASNYTTNVMVGVDKSVSGYDHRDHAQILFTPVVED